MRGGRGRGAIGKSRSHVREREQVRERGKVGSSFNMRSIGIMEGGVQLEDRDIMIKEEMRLESMARRNEAQNSPVYVGLVVELRDSFGFLQPICSVDMHSHSETLNRIAEQLYLQDREGYPGIEIGHEVFF